MNAVGRLGRAIRTIFLAQPRERPVQTVAQAVDEPRDGVGDGHLRRFVRIVGEVVGQLGHGVSSISVSGGTVVWAA